MFDTVLTRAGSSVLLGLVMLGCAADPADPARPNAETTTGVVVGLELEGLPEGGVFKGVPFAAPPTGERRWRVPAPPVPWSEPFAATAFAPACMQSRAITDWYADVAEAVGASRSDAAEPNGVSEDCLYLNVWTPDLDPDQPAPVMVYIHGGSYTSGWSYEPNYHGEAFARRGVIVVSVAYRLGAFGYLAPADEDVTYNAGLHDQLAALEWVQANIAAFGGDPSRVTIFGESAGAAAVGALLVTPAGEGLFHRAISQSGGFEFYEERTEDSAAAGFDRLAAALGTDPMTATAEAIMAAAAQSVDDYDFGPVPGEAILPQSLRLALDAGALARVPLMIGTNRDEWLMYLDADGREDELREWRDSLGDAVVDAMLEQTGSVDTTLDRLQTAGWMRCPGQALAHAMGRLDVPVFMYRLERVRPRAETIGAYHGAELPYVFDTHDPWLPTEEIDRALGRSMNAAWANFAAQGDPNGAGAPDWPEFGETGNVLILDADIRPGPPLDSPICPLIGWSESQ